MKWLPRTESALGFALIIYFYFIQFDFSWLLFVVGFLIPDISALGFLVNEKTGNVCYDIGHTLIGPIILGGLALIGAWYGLLAAALIWSAHILGDRTLGFGLRY
ncbi:DUF4260 family protein [Lacticaseibacillus casei]|uniref:DUF4260 family protein n=1 Tax=Lacticaseibacillus casei TaxID=1582 RepID=UPI001107D46A|nr:DUF4260 family protein [Lacticaseibacillus casei]TLQ49909.1 DUF4260 family protein [Lacticaseibacillus casei]